MQIFDLTDAVSYLSDIVNRFLHHVRDDRRCGSIVEVFYFYWKSLVRPDKTRLNLRVDY